jgi:NADH:ubiquinone oxidoreductase subunit F (NADH-binding)
MYDMLLRISEGRGSLEDVLSLEELCDLLKSTSLCGLGQTAPNPVLTTLKYFRNEYTSHIDEKRCPAGVCTIKAQEEVPV